MSADTEIKINFTLEVKKAQEAIENMSKALEALHEKASKPLALNNGASPSGDETREKNMNPADVASLNKAMSDTAKAIAQTTTELVKLGNSFQKNGVPTEKAQEVASLAENYTALAQAITTANTALASLGGISGSVSPQLSETTKQLNDLRGEVELLKRELETERQRNLAPVAGGAGTTRTGAMSANVRTITLLQQAQAARRLGDVISELGEQFSSLAENAKNGTLNITGMVASIATLGYTMKAALAPITAVVLGVELLQGAWKAYASSTKRARDAERDIQSTMAISESAYRNAAKAKEEYLQKKAREEEIASLRTQYVNLNDELERGLDLINRTTKAEIARLALIEDESDHKETLEKAELGRQFASGEISEEDYQKALINLSSQNKERKAKAAIENAELRRQGTDKRLEIVRADYAEKERIANEHEVYLNQFLSEEEISAMQENYERLTKKREEKASLLREARNEQKYMVWGGLGGVEAIKLNAKVEGLKKELHAVDSAIADYERFMQDTIGTDDIKDYSTRRTHAKEKYTIAKREQEETSEIVKVAYEADEQAKIDLEETRKKSIQEIAQAQESAKSELETMRTKAEARKKQAQLDEEFRRVQKELEVMTNEEINQARQDISSRRKNTKNHKEREHLDRIDSLFSQELEKNRDKGRATVQEVRNLSRQENNQVTRWANENVETYANGRITANQAQELISRMDKALQTQSKVDNDVMSALARQVSYAENVTRRQQQEINRLKAALEKSIRQSKHAMTN